MMRILQLLFPWLLCEDDPITQRRHRNHRRHGKLRMALFISPKDGSMAKTVLHTDDSGVRAVLVFTDRHGNPAAPAFPPAWSLSNDSLMSLTVSDDGLTATLVPTGGVGDLTVDVVAEGDPTPGVNTLHASGDIQILAAEAAFVELQFNPLTPT